jgi:hypothetical protein
VTHRRLRNAGQLETKGAIGATVLHSATNKRLKRSLLGEWDLFQNITSEQFFLGELEKRSRLNEKECNWRSGLDQMTNVICFGKWIANSS